MDRKTKPRSTYDQDLYEARVQKALAQYSDVRGIGKAGKRRKRTAL